jgi:hypothetical protein
MNPTTRKSIITRMAKAFFVSEFTLRIIRQDGTVRANRRFTSAQFINSSDWFAACSADRDHIYFRPLGPLCWVLVDDLTQTGLQWMRDDGVHPNVLVETNPHTPDNLQAWVCIGRDVPDDVASTAARILAARYGGDPAAASHSQVGRVVCTYNAKPNHWREGKKPPLVKLRFADGQCVFIASSLCDEAKAVKSAERQDAASAVIGVFDGVFDDDINALVADLFDDALSRFPDDRSRADLSVARTMHDAGTATEQIVAALMMHSDKAQGREQRKAGAGRRYAERTVRMLMQQQ